MSLLVRTCSTERMNVARLIARLLVGAGGLIWAVMFFAQASTQRYGDLTYTFTDVMNAGVSAIIPTIIAIGVFVLGMYYERLAAAALFVAAAGVVVWGVVVGWEAAVWVSVMIVLAFPMVISAALFLLAASTQRVCELEGVI